MARGRRVGRRIAIADPALLSGGTLAIRRDGRADECEALEKPWPKRLVGSNPTPSAHGETDKPYRFGR
jgi:hypothetical protein